MNRRNFIGSVIGSLAISRLPFIATLNPIKLDKDISKLDLFLTSNEQLLKLISGVLHAGYHPSELNQIKFSKIIGIQRLFGIETKTANVIFEFESIQANTTFYAKGASLVTKQGNIELGYKNFYSRTEYLCPGDELKIKYCVGADLPLRQKREFIELMTPEERHVNAEFY